MDDIIKEYIEFFNDVKDRSFVLKNSFPIVWFGNLEEYKKSEFKVLTLGQNPSDKEFYDEEGSPLNDDKKRFNNVDLNGDQQQLIEDLKNAYNEYFEKNPYNRWFSPYKKLLNYLDCPYYREDEEFKTIEGNNNTAIHIDLTPISTLPTWGGLNDKKINAIYKKEFFYNQLTNLKPDLIITSMLKFEKEMNDLKCLIKLKTIKSFRKKSFYFVFYYLEFSGHKCLVVDGKHGDYRFNYGDAIIEKVFSDIRKKLKIIYIREKNNKNIRMINGRFKRINRKKVILYDFDNVESILKKEGFKEI